MLIGIIQVASFCRRVVPLDVVADIEFADVQFKLRAEFRRFPSQFPFYTLKADAWTVLKLQGSGIVCIGEDLDGKCALSTGRVEDLKFVNSRIRTHVESCVLDIHSTTSRLIFEGRPAG